MTHKSAKRIWLTHAEMRKTDTDELRELFEKSRLHMSDMQRNLVDGMLEGKSDAQAARDAGYTKKDKNPGWAARQSKKVQHLLAIGREIASRGAGTTPEWVRTELKAVYEKARDDEDLTAATKCLMELCRIDGHYAEQQLKLMHAGHDGGALDRDVSEGEWDMLSHLYHELRDDEEDHLH